MGLLLSLAGTLTESPGPRSSLELVDWILSGRLTGRLADLLLSSYTFCGDAPDDLSGLVRLTTELRERVMSNLDSLLASVCRELEENRMRCYIAETRDEARKIVGEIVGSGKIVFKSFALTLEECGIGEHLSRIGNEVHDAEFPILAKDLGRFEDLNTYRGKIERADFGITDAASLSVDPGALFLLPRSGLERLISMVPPRHVALVGLDQLARSYEEGFRIVELAMRLDRSLSYAGVVGGPSKTGDIEKKIVYGAHGPREVHVVLLDDGRREAAVRSPLKEALALPSLGKIPCRQLWPFWKEILGIEGSKELSKSLLAGNETRYLGIDIGHLLEAL